LSPDNASPLILSNTRLKQAFQQPLRTSKTSFSVYFNINPVKLEEQTSFPAVKKPLGLFNSLLVINISRFFAETKKREYAFRSY
jgi:hypothetical protein